MHGLVFSGKGRRISCQTLGKNGCGSALLRACIIFTQETAASYTAQSEKPSVQNNDMGACGPDEGLEDLTAKPPLPLGVGVGFQFNHLPLPSAGRLKASDTSQIECAL